MKDMREEGREMKERAERAMETSRRINNFANWLKTTTTVTADEAFAQSAAIADGNPVTHAAIDRLVRAKFPEKPAPRHKTKKPKAPPAPASTRFVLLDDKWQCVYVEGQVFDLKDREQIKKALSFLYDRGFTSTTGKRAPVKDVCKAAGQKAKEPNLHSIFHVADKPTSPDVDYDNLYDLAIDSHRTTGVCLKT